MKERDRQRQAKEGTGPPEHARIYNSVNPLKKYPINCSAQGRQRVTKGSLVGDEPRYIWLDPYRRGSNISSTMVVMYLPLEVI